MIAYVISSYYRQIGGVDTSAKQLSEGCYGAGYDIPVLGYQVDDSLVDEWIGSVRQFKCLEDLADVLGALGCGQIYRFRLSVVDEMWNSWLTSDRAIANSQRADLIEHMTPHVTDAELNAYFESAVSVVLQYQRSSSSRLPHIASSSWTCTQPVVSVL